MERQAQAEGRGPLVVAVPRPDDDAAPIARVVQRRLQPRRHARHLDARICSLLLPLLPAAQGRGVHRLRRAHQAGERAAGRQRVDGPQRREGQRREDGEDEEADEPGADDGDALAGDGAFLGWGGGGGEGVSRRVGLMGWLGVCVKG